MYKNKIVFCTYLYAYYNILHYTIHNNNNNNNNSSCWVLYFYYHHPYMSLTHNTK